MIKFSRILIFGALLIGIGIRDAKGATTSRPDDDLLMEMELNDSENETGKSNGNESTNHESEARNKAAVLHVINELFGNKNVDILDRYHSGEKYIQHNPLLPDGREPLRNIAKKWFEGQEKEKIYIPRISAEDDLVWVHYKLNNFNGKKVAIVDIFRFENDKIVEHWDVIQPIGDPKDSANDHPMF